MPHVWINSYIRNRLFQDRAIGVTRIIVTDSRGSSGLAFQFGLNPETFESKKTNGWGAGFSPQLAFVKSANVQCVSAG